MRKARWATLNKLPFGPENIPQAARKNGTQVTSSFLYFIGSAAFFLCFVFFWLIAPFPWTLPLLCGRSLNVSRRWTRYLLGAGFTLNFLMVFLTLRFILGEGLAMPYTVDGVYIPENWMRTISFAGSFCLTMTALCVMHVHVPGLCTRLIAPFVTGKALMERNWKDDVYDELIQLIEKAKPAKLKRSEQKNNEQRLSLQLSPNKKLAPRIPTPEARLHEEADEPVRADVVDSSIWLFPLVSFLVGFAFYCFVDWFLEASQPFMHCAPLLNATTTILTGTAGAAGLAGRAPAVASATSCLPPRFPSLDYTLCCGITDGKGRMDRLVPALGGYLSAGYGFMCAVGTMMVRWQLNEVNRQITRLLLENRGVVDEAKLQATATMHSRVAELAEKIQQMEQGIADSTTASKQGRWTNSPPPRGNLGDLVRGVTPDCEAAVGGGAATAGMAHGRSLGKRHDLYLSRRELCGCSLEAPGPKPSSTKGTSRFKTVGWADASNHAGAAQDAQMSV